MMISFRTLTNRGGSPPVDKLIKWGYWEKIAKKTGRSKRQLILQLPLPEQ
ncbi:hypothetical protein JXO52_10850 [bacterium]|nr:hypothetical protein [bacterium]